MSEHLHREKNHKEWKETCFTIIPMLISNCLGPRSGSFYTLSRFKHNNINKLKL